MYLKVDKIISMSKLLDLNKITQIKGRYRYDVIIIYKKVGSYLYKYF